MWQNLKKKLSKKQLNLIKSVLSAVLIVASIYLILNYVPFFANRQSLVIVTNSMEPTINVGDIAIINKNYDVETLTVDNIIAFYADLNDDNEEEIVVHYIASIVKDEFDHYTIRTKREGAINPIDWDSWQLDETDLVGIYSFKIPVIGRFVLFLSSWFGKIVVIINIVIIALVIDFFKKEKLLATK